MFPLLRCKSYDWNKIGECLGVEFGFREGLVREGVQRTNENKLEAVLNQWISSHCSDVSWDNLIETLTELSFIDLARDVKSYLQTNPLAISKYNWR